MTFLYLSSKNFSCMTIILRAKRVSTLYFAEQKAQLKGRKFLCNNKESM